MCMTKSSMRSDETFDIFWDYVEKQVSSVDVSQPTLPRHRKVPRRLELHDNEGDHPAMDRR